MLREILLRLPADALCRLRLVCRPWRSLTSDPSFARAHAARHPLIAERGPHRRRVLRPSPPPDPRPTRTPATLLHRSDHGAAWPRLRLAKPRPKLHVQPNRRRGHRDAHQERGGQRHRVPVHTRARPGHRAPQGAPVPIGVDECWPPGAALPCRDARGRPQQ
ncbi:hypothetical protein HU200_036416 [Digitaria exilis]|uniref:F-box domain-containing protein n=1 Tax=Digitaria exilis TaxID=1010633 RepID=A0A835BPS5_9POAL|nr:hypothetical protein HU200_036416 [Digitaria exilis]